MVHGFIMEFVLFEKEAPIGWLILNRPQKRNALSLKLMNEMQNKLRMIAKDKQVKVVILRGNGPSFCAGHDLKELVGDHEESYYHQIFSTCSELMQSFSTIPQPVIAMIHGAATAAGCQLVASCDLAIASDDAVFSTPGVKIGLFCATPMVPLSRVIGRRQALDMLLTGRSVGAKEAKQIGLVNMVVSGDSLTSKTKKWALSIANFSTFTVQFGKKSFYDQIDLDEKSAYEMAIKSIVKNCMHPDADEGIRAMLEKRTPQWKNDEKY
ncbi:MAG: enoyl-CoA hydratase [Candidatus Thermoplasmatota archaeon]|nr:enoyl-CoA hydratase [Candidatus Thermoplasmatota archaeon]MBS3801572.1 enoyl-CoA hydratase [Candidatus Thermoplasmatota archaeon]